MVLPFITSPINLLWISNYLEKGFLVTFLFLLDDPTLLQLAEVRSLIVNHPEDSDSCESGDESVVGTAVAGDRGVKKFEDWDSWESGEDWMGRHFARKGFGVNFFDNSRDWFGENNRLDDSGGASLKKEPSESVDVRDIDAEGWYSVTSVVEQSDGVKRVKNPDDSDSSESGLEWIYLRGCAFGMLVSYI